MAKKTRKSKLRTKLYKTQAKGDEVVRRIQSHPEIVVEAINALDAMGQFASITNIYHTIKGVLGLDYMYNFDAGDAIREVLTRKGYRIQRRDEAGY